MNAVLSKLSFYFCIIAVAYSTERLDPVEVQGTIKNNYGLYNLYLEYNAFDKNYHSETFHLVGFSRQKKDASKSNLPFRYFIITPLGEKKDITNDRMLYPIEEKYRNHRITDNQPSLTTIDYLIYKFEPPIINRSQITGESLMRMSNEFNNFLKARCQFVDHAAHAPPFIYRLKQSKQTTADTCVIISDDLVYLAQLNDRGIGKVTGHALILPLKILPSLASNWHIDSARISHVFPWRADVPLPKTTAEGVWIWCAVSRWVWQAPDGWCIPQFSR